MAKRKNNNLSTQKSKGYSKVVSFGSARALYQWTTMDPHEKFVDMMSQELFEYAECPKTRSVIRFCRERSMPTKTFYEWVDKYPQFKAAHEYVMQCIGERLEDEVAEQSPKEMLSKLYLYHPDWKKVRDDNKEQKIELAKETAKVLDTKQEFTHYEIVMPQLGNHENSGEDNP